MTTSVEGRQCRALTLELFADITDAPVLGSTSQGVLFDGDLTDEEVLAVWWRWTTVDEADEVSLRNIDDLRATDTEASELTRAIAAHLLRMEAT